jgi:nicotinate-nucleotide pyrophosphorylase
MRWARSGAADGPPETAGASALRVLAAAVKIKASVERILCEVDRIEPTIVGGATQILLDNMTPTMPAEAVALVAGRAATEASGGVKGLTPPRSPRASPAPPPAATP